MYDGSDQRVIKTAVDTQGQEVHTVYAFGSLELRRAAWAQDASQGSLFDYQDNEQTEVVFLSAHGARLARLHLEDGLPALGGSTVYVLLELADHLGSGSIVIDRATSELAERMTYTAYGAAESDYRPGRWKAFREDYRFTGKEEDVEVGFQYFGKRYYAPQLGRWVSADPLTVHGAGADLNAYAYVSGDVLDAIEVDGLDGEVIRQNRRVLGSESEKDAYDIGQRLSLVRNVSVMVASWLTRKADMQKRLTQHFAAETGAMYVLNRQEVEALQKNSSSGGRQGFSITHGTRFGERVEELEKQYRSTGREQEQRIRVMSGEVDPTGLGHCSIYWEGTLKVTGPGRWEFKGENACV